MLSDKQACGSQHLEPRLDEPHRRPHADQAFYLAIRQASVFLQNLAVYFLCAPVFQEEVQHTGKLIEFQKVTIAHLKFASKTLLG